MATGGEWENAEPGVRRRILQAQGRLMLMEVQFAAGAAGYEHSHPHEQISYCVAGRFEYSLDGRTHVLAAGPHRRVHAAARGPARQALARSGRAARSLGMSSQRTSARQTVATAMVPSSRRSLHEA
jgi:hypothetical protein